MRCQMAESLLFTSQAARRATCSTVFKHGKVMAFRTIVYMRMGAFLHAGGAPAGTSKM